MSAINLLLLQKSKHYPVFYSLTSDVTQCSSQRGGTLFSNVPHLVLEMHAKSYDL